METDQLLIFVDKTAIVWEVTRDRECFAVAKKSLHGHNHFVQDIALSHDGQYAITCSWDKTMRLWNLVEGKTESRFVGHTSEVLSVSFSPDNRLIVSGGRDKSIKIWNTRGQFKGDFSASRGANNVSGHTDWVSSIRFSPNPSNPLVVSAGWDHAVKVWDMKSPSPQLMVNHLWHQGNVNTITISPDGSLCASGGSDEKIIIWDLNGSKQLFSLDAHAKINALAFCPMRLWLCAATTSSIKVWNLGNHTLVDELKIDASVSSGIPQCVSLAWSADGSTLYAGCTDNTIRVWQVTTTYFA